MGLSVGVVEPAGVPFEGDLRALCLANLQLRTATRVLVRVDEFRAATFHELEKRTARIDWGRWIAPGREVTLRVTCRKSRLYHSGAVAERVAGVLAPLVGRVEVGGAETATAGGDEPNDDGRQLLVVRLLNDRCTLSLRQLRRAPAPARLPAGVGKGAAPRDVRRRAPPGVGMGARDTARRPVLRIGDAGHRGGHAGPSHGAGARAGLRARALA